jgi:DNA-binding transcriptional ArsR family regulator
VGVSRAPTTSDVFNAIAEPRRRDLVELLARSGEQSVNRLVEQLQLPQPTVSKNLSVLRKVGLVSVRKEGPQRFYSLNPVELRPIYDWAKTFERFWANQLDRIKERAERTAREAAAAVPEPPTEE